MSTVCVPAAFGPITTRNTWTASKRAAPVAYTTSLPVTVQRIVNLLDEQGEDDYGRIGPAQFAFKNALRLVAAATYRLGRDFIGAPLVESNGGVRVTWKANGRTVKLVCPESRELPNYVYYSSPAGNSIVQNVTVSDLAERLNWLGERTRTAGN